jgi:undecaprenyl-diphosphatase
MSETPISAVQGATPPEALPALLRPVVHVRAAVIVGIAGILLVVIAGVAITASPAWTVAELNILLGISTVHDSVLDVAALTIATLFGPRIAPFLLVAWCVILALFTRRLTMGATFLVLVGLTWAGNQGIKAIVARPRPDHSAFSHPLALETSFSYPSGHTCFVAASAIAVILMFRASRWQPLVITIATVVTLMVAASRVYLGVHHVSDVVAGMLYASAAAAVILALWNRYATPSLLWLDRLLPRRPTGP